MASEMIRRTKVQKWVQKQEMIITQTAEQLEKLGHNSEDYVQSRKDLLDSLKEELGL